VAAPMIGSGFSFVDAKSTKMMLANKNARFWFFRHEQSW
jgi:hypothetical protein